MNAELMQKALEAVGNANTLVNLVSRRVRQLSAGARPLSGASVTVNGNMGMADIALLELIDARMGWEVPELTELTRAARKTNKSTRAILKAPRAD
jgi:DNA-directed RNA polymerase subunit omega